MKVDPVSIRKTCLWLDISIWSGANWTRNAILKLEADSIACEEYASLVVDMLPCKEQEGMEGRLGNI